MNIHIEPVPLFRCTYLHLFVETLGTLEPNVTSALNRSRLPTELPPCRGEYVPALPTLAYVTDMVERHGIRDFGYLAGARLKVSDFGDEVRRELSKAGTLREALEGYCRQVNHEQSHVLCHVSEQNDGAVRISGMFVPNLDPEQYHYSEWLLVASLMAIIRQTAGRTWLPRQIVFQSQPALGKTVWNAFPDTRFLVGQAATCIYLPSEILDLPWPDSQASVNTQTTGSMPAKVTSHHWDFPHSLSVAIQPYLADGYPSIELAAELAGTSVRTLQRRLKQCHLSYSDLVKQLRFDIAIELLSNPANSVIDTACEVGFSDPSHFSRAFRQMTGISPREYRQQHMVG